MAITVAKYGSSEKASNRVIKHFIRNSYNCLPLSVAMYPLHALFMALDQYDIAPEELSQAFTDSITYLSPDEAQQLKQCDLAPPLYFNKTQEPIVQLVAALAIEKLGAVRQAS